MYVFCRRKLTTPVMPEFKPPQASDFEPTLSARLEPTRARSEFEPKELRVDPSPPAEQAEDDLEESKVCLPLCVVDCCHGDWDTAD